MTQTLTLRLMDDFHCHFRLGGLLAEVLPYTVRYAGRGLAMPNTKPRAILNAADALWYRAEIQRVIDMLVFDHAFEALMTIEIRDTTTPEMILEASQAGNVFAGKVYPRGVTTNSGEGLSDFFHYRIRKTFGAMQEVGMPLLLHGELDRERILVTKREEAFLSILCELAMAFPRLKIVLEHVSTRAAVEMVMSLDENVAATITAHHLCLTLNDVIGYGLQPHHGCMPMPKDFDDRDALIEAVTSGNPKFFFGSDTAPHPRENKECAKGACGVYTAPVVPEVLTEVFEKAVSLDKLEDFTSRFGAEFYGLPLNEGSLTLQKQEWTVPDQIGSVVPFRAGTKFQWQLVSV